MLDILKGLIPLFGIGAIAIIVVVALMNNIDGVMVAGGMAIIGGIAGYTAKGFVEKISQKH